jgi:hypothetical protein
MIGAGGEALPGFRLRSDARLAPGPGLTYDLVSVAAAAGRGGTGDRRDHKNIIVSPGPNR